MGKMFLLVINAYTKWLDVHVTSTSTSAVTIELWHEHLTIYYTVLLRHYYIRYEYYYCYHIIIYSLMVHALCSLNNLSLHNTTWWQCRDRTKEWLKYAYSRLTHSISENQRNGLAGNEDLNNFESHQASRERTPRNRSAHYCIA